LNGLYVPTAASWYPDLRAEVLSLPAGRHDDRVDALGLVGQLLDKMADGRKPAKPKLGFELRDPAYPSPVDEPSDYYQSSVKLL